MAKLAAIDLFVLAQRQGLDAPRARIAAAVALAESGGDSGAIGDIDNPSKGCRSYGLWQINSCPGRDRTGVRADTKALLTPEGNARAMAAISNKGASWSAWTTYRNGAYKAQLAAVDEQTRIFGSGSDGSGALALGGAAAGVAIGGPAGAAVGAGTGAAAGNLDATAQALAFLAKLADPHSWYVVALFVLGLVLVAAGALIIFRKPIAQTAAVAVQAAPIP